MKVARATRPSTTKISRPSSKRGVLPPVGKGGDRGERGSGGSPSKPSKRRARRRAVTGLADSIVLIDTSVGSRDLIHYPPFDECGEHAKLNSGDVCFVGNGPTGLVTVGVELKELNELITSTDNNRLQGTQLPRMLDEYNEVWLLYYGVYRASPVGNQLQLRYGGQWRNHYVGKRAVPYVYLEGFLLALTAIGVNVKHVATKAEAAAWLAELVRWRTKPWGKHKSLRGFDQSRTITRARESAEVKASGRSTLMPILDERTKMRARTAMAWPALGYERALAAARQWTIKQMATATAEEWAALTTTDRVTGAKKRLGKAAGEAIAGIMDW